MKLSEKPNAEFNQVVNMLKADKAPISIETKLVRGLDYYGGLVFEWVTENLGSQATVCAGGRFDTLVEQLCGHAWPPTAGVAWMRLLAAPLTLGFYLPLLLGCGEVCRCTSRARFRVGWTLS